MTMTAKKLLDLTQKQNKTNRSFELGTIDTDYTSGRPRILFDGYTTTSIKEYAYLASYTPVAGDRVLLASVSGTYIVIDKIV